MYKCVPNYLLVLNAEVMGFIKIIKLVMAFIQYFSQANSKSLVDSFLPLLENYGMIIPETFLHSRQLYAEFKSNENNCFAKVNVLISWVDQNQQKCSVEIWSDEPFAREKTLCRKVHNEISQLIIPCNLPLRNKSIKGYKNA